MQFSVASFSVPMPRVDITQGRLNVLCLTNMEDRRARHGKQLGKHSHIPRLAALDRRTKMDDSLVTAVADVVAGFVVLHLTQTDSDLLMHPILKCMPTLLACT
jgi:hypothetical protein